MVPTAIPKMKGVIQATSFSNCTMIVNDKGNVFGFGKNGKKSRMGIEDEVTHVPK